MYNKYSQINAHLQPLHNKVHQRMQGPLHEVCVICESITANN